MSLPIVAQTEEAREGNLIDLFTAGGLQHFPTLYSTRVSVNYYLIRCYPYINNQIQDQKGNFDYPLFCVNTGNNKDYSKISFQKTRLIMEKLFPDPSPYEINDYNVIPNLAFDVIKKLEDEINNLNNNQDKQAIIDLQTENKEIKA